MRCSIRAACLAAALFTALPAGPGRAADFPEPIDHLAVLKDLLAMPRPTSCDAAKADLTTLDMQVCSANAFRDADAALNRAYQAASKEASPQARALLRTAERAWLIYRDAQCAWEASRFEGGSLAPVSYGQCLVDVTLVRVRTLNGDKP